MCRLSRVRARRWCGSCGRARGRRSGSWRPPSRSCCAWAPPRGLRASAVRLAPSPIRPRACASAAPPLDVDTTHTLRAPARPCSASSA
eukprot:112716-Prymnesium_polylepis.1